MHGMMRSLMRGILAAMFLVGAGSGMVRGVAAGPDTRTVPGDRAFPSGVVSWRSATEAELTQALPERASVLKERIETEMRTASGVVDGQGRMIAGVVLITAGYSADGKYSHYLMAGSAIRLDGHLSLQPGNYVFGWRRVPEGLDVHFYEAATGTERGRATAKRMGGDARVEAFRITPPGEDGVLQIGRFAIPYTIP